MIEARNHQPHAWYALRRTLPPWRFEENLHEMIACLPRYGVDEVIIKVDTEEFSHGHPTLSWLEAYQPKLFQIKQAMEALGIVYSLNPWVTQGHSDRGWDCRQVMGGAQMMVGHDGAQCKACACPLSEAWRDYTTQIWTLYAQTRPRVIWIEDDIRTFNHAPVRFGCFCPQHMRMFSQAVGEKVTPQQLVQAMLQPGEPHPWRGIFLEMQGRVMTEAVRHLARTVHAVDPDICMGLMSSGAHLHSIEGRPWHAFAEALANGRPLYSRAPLANYSESSLRGLYVSQDSIQATRHVLPAGTVEQTEVENYTYSRYANSAVFTFLKMAVSFAYASHGVAMNLYEHDGLPMEADPTFGRMLGQKKPLLNTLAKACQQPGVYRGVRLLHHPEASRFKALSPGADYADLAPDHHACMEQLEAHGIPTTYDDSPVIAAAGQTLNAFDDEEIRQMLTGGLLLDAVAAGILAERGFAREIGLKQIASPRSIDACGPFGAEAYFNPQFGGAEGNYLTIPVGERGRPNVSVLDPVPDAKVISRLVDPDAKQHHVCMYGYENPFGGRVVVQAFDLTSAYNVNYCRPMRARQLQGAVQWLARNRFPLLVQGGPWPMTFRKDGEGQTILGLFNLSLDAWPTVTFDLDDAKHADRMQVLSPSGWWRTTNTVTVRRIKGRLMVTYAKMVPHHSPLFLRIRWCT